MNEIKTEKAFNTKTLMSLLVGVIAMIVIIPTISTIMNKKPKESPNYRIMLNESASITPGFDFEIVIESSEGAMYYFTKGYFPTYYYTASLGHFIVYYEDYTTTFDFYQPKDYTLSFKVTLSYDTYYRSSNELIDEGIYDFTHYYNTEIDNNDTLEPIYTPW